MTDRELVRLLGPAGQSFFGSFAALREVQRQSIAPILRGENLLVCSATASGKTEAVLAPLIARVGTFNIKPDEIAILAVAPTRALVNDLYARLEAPLDRIGWTCGRQSSDHRDKLHRPRLLITTPESFDSMLVRDGQHRDERLSGHLLAHIAAVFLDEAHLFDSTPRGDQLVWLLGRLRRLRRHALQEGWTTGHGLQACAASATVSAPSTLAGRLLGEGSTAVVVPGRRGIEILNAVGDDWASLDSVAGLDEIQHHVSHIEHHDDLDGIAQRIWKALEPGGQSGCRKALVFTPTRALCDRLSLAISDLLRNHRDIYVGAHHGSLEREVREEAEKGFARSRDAVLVATTTLEVGIDIGDVDTVAIVGCPPDTSSLLQRIGRSGRRSGRVRVVPIARDALESRALASMLDAANNGSLDPCSRARLWSVFVQQVASHTAQAGKRGRRRADLLALAQEVWPEPGGPTTASTILAQLAQEGHLAETGERIHLGTEWSDRFEKAGGAFHNNFESANQGTPVVDSATGETLTYVNLPPLGARQVALGGRRWDFRIAAGEIVLSTPLQAGTVDAFRYQARAAPIGRSYAAHVRRGLGFHDSSAPLIHGPLGSSWFHFGGSEYEALLLALFPGLHHLAGFAGLALRGDISEARIRSLLLNSRLASATIANAALSASFGAGLGKHHDLLPPAVRRSVVLERLDPDAFLNWLASRRIESVSATSDDVGRLRDSLGW